MNIHGYKLRLNGARQMIRKIRTTKHDRATKERYIKKIEIGMENTRAKIRELRANKKARRTK